MIISNFRYLCRVAIELSDQCDPNEKAEGSLEALKNLSAPDAKVIRDGKEMTIPANELVVGDIIVLLDAGDYVPADGRLLEGWFTKS